MNLTVLMISWVVCLPFSDVNLMLHLDSGISVVFACVRLAYVN